MAVSELAYIPGLSTTKTLYHHYCMNKREILLL